MADFLILSLKYSTDEKIAWWRPDNAGYTPDIERAGRYTAQAVSERPDYYSNGVTTMAIVDRPSAPAIARAAVSVRSLAKQLAEADHG